MTYQAFSLSLDCLSDRFYIVNGNLSPSEYERRLYQTVRHHPILLKRYYRRLSKESRKNLKAHLNNYKREHQPALLSALVGYNTPELEEMGISFRGQGR